MKLVAREPLSPTEEYFVRVSEVLCYPTRFDDWTGRVVELAPELVGLRLSFLHRRGCHYLRQREGDSNGHAVLRVRPSALADALPRCKRCFGPGRARDRGRGPKEAEPAERGELNRPLSEVVHDVFGPGS